MTKARTHRQAKAIAVRQAKAARRWAIVRDASAAGKSKFEAAAMAGLTVGGLASLLAREVGDRGWPISSEREE